MPDAVGGAVATDVLEATVEMLQPGQPTRAPLARAFAAECGGPAAVLAPLARPHAETRALAIRLLAALLPRSRNDGGGPGSGTGAHASAAVGFEKFAAAPGAFVHSISSTFAGGSSGGAGAGGSGTEPPRDPRGRFRPPGALRRRRGVSFDVSAHAGYSRGALRARPGRSTRPRAPRPGGSRLARRQNAQKPRGGGIPRRVQGCLRRRLQGSSVHGRRRRGGGDDDGIRVWRGAPSSRRRRVVQGRPRDRPRRRRGASSSPARKVSGRADARGCARTLAQARGGRARQRAGAPRTSRVARVARPGRARTIPRTRIRGGRAARQRREPHGARIDVSDVPRAPRARRAAHARRRVRRGDFHRRHRRRRRSGWVRRAPPRRVACSPTRSTRSSNPGTSRTATEHPKGATARGPSSSARRYPRRRAGKICGRSCHSWTPSPPKRRRRRNERRTIPRVTIPRVIPGANVFPAAPEEGPRAPPPRAGSIRRWTRTPGACSTRRGASWRRSRTHPGRGAAWDSTVPRPGRIAPPDRFPRRTIPGGLKISSLSSGAGVQEARGGATRGASTRRVPTRARVRAPRADGVRDGGGGGVGESSPRAPGARRGRLSGGRRGGGRERGRQPGGEKASASARLHLFLTSLVRAESAFANVDPGRARLAERLVAAAAGAGKDLLGGSALAGGVVGVAGGGEGGGERRWTARARAPSQPPWYHPALGWGWGLRGLISDQKAAAGAAEEAREGRRVSDALRDAAVGAGTPQRSPTPTNATPNARSANVTASRSRRCAIASVSAAPWRAPRTRKRRRRWIADGAICTAS